MRLVGRSVASLDLDDEAPWPSIVDQFLDTYENTSQILENNAGGGDIIDDLLS